MKQIMTILIGVTSALWLCAGDAAAIPNMGQSANGMQMDRSLMAAMQSLDKTFADNGTDSPVLVAKFGHRLKKAAKKVGKGIKKSIKKPTKFVIKGSKKATKKTARFVGRTTKKSVLFTGKVVKKSTKASVKVIKKTSKKPTKRSARFFKKLTKKTTPHRRHRR